MSDKFYRHQDVKSLEELRVVDPGMYMYLIRNLEGIVQNIYKVCDQKGLNYAQLAKGTHMSPPYFNKLFSGRMNLSLISLLKVAYFLDVDAEDLFPNDVLSDRMSYGDRFDLITEREPVKIKNDLYEVNLQIMKLINDVRSR